jgi:hypothetical protein
VSSFFLEKTFSVGVSDIEGAGEEPALAVKTQAQSGSAPFYRAEAKNTANA